MKLNWRRSNYLINPKLQIKYSLFVALVTLLSSTLVIFLIKNNLQSSYYTLINSTHELTPKLVDNLQAGLDRTLYQLIVILAIMVCLVFAFTIYYTHRVFGPIWKLKKGLKQLASGDYSHIKFRSKDAFHELASDFNQVSDQLAGREKSDKS